MPAKSHQHTYAFGRWYRERFNPSSAYGGWNAAGTGTFTVTDTRSDPGSVADWKKRIADVTSATTTLTGTQHKIVLVPDGMTHAKRYFGSPSNIVEQETYGCYAFVGQGLNGPSGFVINSVQAEALMEMVQKVRQANTSLQGQIVAGEMAESLRLVNSAGKNLRHGMRDYLNDITRIARRSNPRHLMRTIGHRWLEYSFGWKPLLKDIDDGISAVQRLRGKREPRVLVRASKRSSQMNETTYDSYSLAGYDFSIKTMRRYTYGYKIYGCVKIASGNLAIAHEFGLKLDEFLPTIWELIPYSFLADYFVNLGAIIDAYALNTSSIRWMNAGELRQADLLAVASAKRTPVSGWVLSEGSVRLGSPYQQRWREIARGPYYGNYIPGLVFRIPGCGTQWLNIAALVSQHADTSRNVRRAFR